MNRLALLLIGMFLFASCNNTDQNNSTTTTSAIAAPINLSYTVLNIYPHDTSSFTEGLIWLDGHL